MRTPFCSNNLNLAGPEDGVSVIDFEYVHRKSSHPRKHHPAPTNRATRRHPKSRSKHCPAVSYKSSSEDAATTLIDLGDYNPEPASPVLARKTDDGSAVVTGEEEELLVLPASVYVPPIATGHSVAGLVNDTRSLTDTYASPTSQHDAEPDSKQQDLSLLPATVYNPSSFEVNGTMTVSDTDEQDLLDTPEMGLDLRTEQRPQTGELLQVDKVAAVRDSSEIRYTDKDARHSDAQDGGFRLLGRMPSGINEYRTKSSRETRGRGSYAGSDILRMTEDAPEVQRVPQSRNFVGRLLECAGRRKNQNDDVE